MAGYQYQYGGYPSYQNGYQQPQMNYQQPQMQQPQLQMPPIQPQVQNTGILYVDGDKGAEEFQMLPNTFAFLKSTDGKAVYFKQSLANGAITCDKYTFCEKKPELPNSFEYVTREEFEEFVKSIKNVKEKEYESNNEHNGKYAKPNSKPAKLSTADAESRDNRS